MATKAIHTTAPLRAPRFPAPAGSIAAFAQSKSNDIDLAEAWVLLWQACGGILTVTEDGKRFTCMPDPAQRSDGLLRPIGFSPRDEAEWRGATMALASLLSLAGEASIDAVFSMAPEARGY